LWVKHRGRGPDQKGVDELRRKGNSYKRVEGERPRIRHMGCKGRCGGERPGGTGGHRGGGATHSEIKFCDAGGKGPFVRLRAGVEDVVGGGGVNKKRLLRTEEPHKSKNQPERGNAPAERKNFERR